MGLVAPILLGIAQGAQHSLEPDHVAAISSLLGDRRGAGRGAWLGAIWGFGHTVSLIAMCIAVVELGAMLPPAADRAFTLIVAAMLIALGARTLWPTRHGAARRAVRGPIQALAIGAMHGLAGSSALVAMAAGTLPDTGARLLYVTLFGVGSIAGMALISGSASLWLGRIRRRGFVDALRITVGALSIAIGVKTAVGAL